MDEALKQYTAFTIGNLGFFKCECMPIRLCNAPATFQRLIQNCLGELSLIYCLIYLYDIIVFLKTKEEHLHVVFDHFQEHKLKLEPTKYDFFWDEINYQAHHISRDGVRPSKENLKALAKFAPSWTYTEIWAFLGLVGYFQPLHKHLSGESVSKKSEWVMLMAEAEDTFVALKKACLEAPVLAFANFDKSFLPETDASKLGLGAMLSQKQTDGWYHLVAYASQSLTIHDHTYHSMKQEFLALRWTIAEQFQEYLLWKPFIFRTNNNLLTYIMITPNFDATLHWWVASLARFTFSLE